MWREKNQNNPPAPKCVSDRWMDIHKICCLWPQLPQNGAVKMLMFWFTFKALFNSLKHQVSHSRSDRRHFEFCIITEDQWISSMSALHALDCPSYDHLWLILHQITHIPAYMINICIQVSDSFCNRKCSSSETCLNYTAVSSCGVGTFKC